MKKNIEKEYKYIIPSEIIYGEEAFNEIKKVLSLKNKKELLNIDTYYDANDVLHDYGITIRVRHAKGIEKDIITVKLPDDHKNFSQRQELEFDNTTDLYNFLHDEIGYPLNDLTKKFIIYNSRESYTIEYNNSIIEISFDEYREDTYYHLLSPHYMIECELKEGSEKDLEALNKKIMELGYTSICDKSKCELISKTHIKPKEEFVSSMPEEEYKKKVAHYFSGSILSSSYDELQRLDDKKQEIRRLRSEKGPLDEPLVITLSGTPRAGKTTVIDNLFEFLKKSDLKTKCLEEPAGIIYSTLKSKEEKQDILKDRIGFVEKQYDIGKTYISNNLEGNDIILCDRGAIDPFIWYDMYYRLGMIDEDQYREFISNLSKGSGYSDMFYALYTDSEESMKRDYLSSLSLEQRTTRNETNVKRYNESLIRMMPAFKRSLDYTKFIDTTNKQKMDASIVVADEVLDKVKRLYMKK